ncbi:MAG: hypothetical protein GXP19_10110 [Gammaproteobacteria bacterium]|nr:hypothetical protein [Gammaproteobacteria bacterium]
MGSGVFDPVHIHWKLVITLHNNVTSVVHMDLFVGGGFWGKISSTILQSQQDNAYVTSFTSNIEHTSM